MIPTHLLHVFSTFRPAGPQIRFVTIANLLDEEFRHTIMAMDGNYEASKRLEPHIRVDLLPPPESESSMFCLFDMRKLARTLRPDLALTYNWGAMDAAAGFALAGVCPVIHTEDGFGPDEAVALKRRRVLARRFLLNRIHATIVPSKTLLGIAREQYRLPPEKLRFIANGVNTQKLRPDAKRISRSLLGADEDTFLIGFVGHLRPEKNLQMLMRAYAKARLKHSKLVLIGDGGQRPALMSLAAELGITDQVVFTGAVENPAEYLLSTDLFVMSSSTEQMPMALLEAMACGLATLCTNVGDSSEILDADGFPVMVPVNDTEAYAAALNFMADTPEFRRRLGSENRKRCVTRYSLEGMVGTYAALYHNAVAQTRSLTA